MIYSIKDKPNFGKILLFALQMMLSCFTATALIAQVCGVPLSGAFVGSGVATIVYMLWTGFNSPMYISNSGAFVTPVLFALQLGGAIAVALGGAIACIVYCIFGVIFTRIRVDNIYKVLPKVLIGTITLVIGVNLMGFIPGYIGDTGNIGFVVALITVLTIALTSHYCKGALSMFPFLIGTLVGYIVAIPFGLVDFSHFNNIKLFTIPDFGFLHWVDMELTFSEAINLVIIFSAFTVSAICECLSDHAVLGGIIGVDLYKRPGLGKIFIGEGMANLASSFLGQLGACSYGESIGAIGFSKCASIYTTFVAAIFMILLGFLQPVQAFISSIPSCVIGGGTACVLYGFISSSGIRTLQTVDFTNQKNLIICSVVAAIGISGVSIGTATFSLSGTALALIIGIIINLILKDK